MGFTGLLKPILPMHFVFDFAGVLFHWQPHQVVRRELPRRASDDAAARRWAEAIFQGYGGDWAEFDRGTVAVPDLVRRIAVRTGLDEHEVHQVVMAVPAELRPVPQTVALLRRLHAAGRRLFYLSNMPEPYAAHLETTHEFLAHFEAGVFSSRVGLIKPELPIYALAAARFDVDASALVFLDDVAANVHAAREAGWQALEFADAASCETQLRERGWL